MQNWPQHQVWPHLGQVASACCDGPIPLSLCEGGLASESDSLALTGGSSHGTDVSVAVGHPAWGTLNGLVLRAAPGAIEKSELVSQATATQGTHLDASHVGNACVPQRCTAARSTSTRSSQE